MDMTDLWTVSRLSALAGVSIKTLRYYDKIGLLRPDSRSESGYRLYGPKSLARLQQILLLRELAFPLEEIGRILDQPGYDPKAALAEQIQLLLLRRQRLDDIIAHAKLLQQDEGGSWMNFSAYDEKTIDAYAQEAKARWGQEAAYKDYEQRAKKRSPQEQQRLNQELLDLFRQLGQYRQGSPAAPEAQALVARLQQHLEQHYYHCPPELFANLGQLYVGDPRFTKNIDKMGGDGTAAFAAQAIAHYCQEQQKA